MGRDDSLSRFRNDRRKGGICVARRKRNKPTKGDLISTGKERHFRGTLFEAGKRMCL